LKTSSRRRKPNCCEEEEEEEEKGEEEEEGKRHKAASCCYSRFTSDGNTFSLSQFRGIRSGHRWTSTYFSEIRLLPERRASLWRSSSTILSRSSSIL
jgi:hypothetical protein